MKNSNSIIYILALANASTVVGLGLITPSILIIRHDFVVSSEIVQLVLTFYMAAAGVGQLIFGTISDRFGRRPVLLLGGFLFASASVLSVFSPNIYCLLFLRIIQGLGAAACMSMARVIVTDSFKKSEAAEKLSLLTAIMVIFPLISLILGGFIAETIGWIGTMYIFAFIGFIIFSSVLLKVSETKTDRLDSLDILKICASYAKVLSNSKFLIFTFICSIQSGVFFSSFGFMPYEFARIGVAPLEFGFWFSFAGVGYFFGNLVNRKFAIYWGIENLVSIGCFLSLMSYFLIMLMHLSSFSNPLYISLPLIIFGLGNGFTVANCIAGGVSAAGKHSGTATGITGALQMLSGGFLGTIIIGLGGDQNFLICLLFVNALCMSAFLLSLINYAKTN